MTSQKIRAPEIHPGLWCYNCGRLGHHVTIQCPFTVVRTEKKKKLK